MRKIIVGAMVSLDGVMQAPGGPTEDPTRGFKFGGWVKDRFGLSWQIVPRVLTQRLSDPDPAKARRVMEAMLQMKRIDIAAIERAYQGETADA